MSYQKQSFGMMDEGYFVPRGEIIDWINNLLDLSLTKIQQLGAGSVYCQIVDVIHPGKVPMNKVNWKAKSDYQFINNLKILQTAFDKAGVKRYVQVQKLAKTKYQDNLQFIQWLKRYYDLNCGDRGSNYNPKERRGNAPVDFSFAEKNVVPKSFNSGGQMQSKSQLPGKKSIQVIPNKSSVGQQKVQAKIQTKPQKHQKIQVKPSTKVQVKPSTKVQGRSGTKNEVRPATKLQVKTPVKTQTKGPVKVQKKHPQKVVKQQTKPVKDKWEELYKKQNEKNKDLSMKVSMIDQVLRSQDNAQLKVALLEQILGFVPNKKQQKQPVQHHDFQIQATQDYQDHQEHQQNQDHNEHSDHHYEQKQNGESHHQDFQIQANQQHDDEQII